MKIATFLLLTASLLSFSEGAELNKCTEKDVCSSIVFNQLAVSSIQEDIGKLVTNSILKLLNFAEEMRLTTINLKKSLVTSLFNPKDIEDCHTESDNLVEVIRNLEFQTKTMAEDDGRQKQLEALQGEQAKLENETKSLEAELSALQQDLSHQQEKVWNLTRSIYKPMDCADVQLLGHSENGVYTIYPQGYENPVQVLCDLTSNGGAWTVFINRREQTEMLDFNVPWEDCKKGFGDISNEFWLGNDLLNQMTSDVPSMLRMDAEDFTGDNRFAQWRSFSVGDEDAKYQLTVKDYESFSTTGDSLSESTGMAFTTRDRDNDANDDINCASNGLSSTSSLLGKGPWWYKSCGSTRPTAPILHTNYWNSASYGHWNKIGFQMVSFKAVSMKFRRLNHEKFLGLASSVQSLC